MATCCYCGDEMPHLYYTCKFCEHQHCTEHRLPENHKCPHLTALRHDSSTWFFSEGNSGGDRSRRFLGRVSDAISSDDEPADVNADLIEDEDSMDEPLERYDEQPWIVEEDQHPKDLEERHSGHSRQQDRSDDRDRPQPIDPDDLQSYSGSASATEWKKEARARDAGPDVAPDGSLIYPNEPESHKADSEESESLISAKIRSAMGRAGSIFKKIVILFLVAVIIFYIGGVLFVAAEGPETLEENIASVTGDEEFAQHVTDAIAAGFPEAGGDTTDDSTHRGSAAGGDDETDEPVDGADEAEGEGSLFDRFITGQESLDTELIEEKVAVGVNDIRNEHERGELEFYEPLADAAHVHSEHMNETGRLTHDWMDGTTPQDRARAAGAGCWVGENVAQTWYNQRVVTDSGTERYTNEEEIAEGLVEQWMESDGHFENIVYPEYDYQGVGIVVDGDERVWATHKFCFTD